MNSNRVAVAVVGAGPAGLSAATYAARLGLSYVLLERAAHHADTIQRYQKGKHVMAEPSKLPLHEHCPLEFKASTREQVLASWKRTLSDRDVNIRYRAEVVGITGKKGNFIVALKDHEPVAAEHVILAIGMQGNLRRLGKPGTDLPAVQYQLDDPEEYQGETIIVVGASDAAIENAVALAERNAVIIINRKDEFARPKPKNRQLILELIEQRRIQCFYGSTLEKLEKSTAGKPYALTINTPGGKEELPCDRIIARLGAIPPRKFLEPFGIRFVNDADTAFPQLDTTYQSSVPGLYIIGALGGYPLIKQALNQGYEVVEYILGHDVKPADHDLLQQKLKKLPFGHDVNETLQLLQRRIPVFGKIDSLTFRDFILDSEFRILNQGDTIYRKNESTDSFYTVLESAVYLDLEGDPNKRQCLDRGQIFGEQSPLSGRCRNETAVAAEHCIVLETPRHTMIKLINSNDYYKDGIDRLFIGRAIQLGLTPRLSLIELKETINAVSIQRFDADDAIYKEGDPGNSLHLIRRGSVAVFQKINNRDVLLANVHAGRFVGELGMLGSKRRMDSVRATAKTETIEIDYHTFRQLQKKDPELKAAVQSCIERRKEEETRLAIQPRGGEVLNFLMKEGLGEATDVLLIDQHLCIGCDNCEKACAETHGGVSRLKRHQGPSYAKIHIPTACRHCEHPYCMEECPPNVIHRARDGAVYIDEGCIGCEKCQQNCPYDAIQMASESPSRPGLIHRLLSGLGPKKDEDRRESTGQRHQAANDQKKAVKCDLCKDLSGGPACVRACPTGAAIRIGQDQYVDLAIRAAQRN